jgi:hypothetical protein
VTFGSEGHEAYGVLEDDEFLAVADEESPEEPPRPAHKSKPPPRAAPARALRVVVVVLVAGVGGAALGLAAVSAMRGVGATGSRAGAVSRLATQRGATPTVIAAEAVAGARRVPRRPAYRLRGGRTEAHRDLADGASSRSLTPSATGRERATGAISASEGDISPATESVGAEFGFER